MKVKNRYRLVLGIVFGMLSFMAVPVSGSDCPFYEEYGSHNYSIVDYEPAGCVSAGYIHSICEVCRVEKWEPLPVLGHDYVYNGEGEDSTCMSQGWYGLTCSRCGDTYHEPLPYAEHYMIDTGDDVYSTCVTQGYRTYRCIWCGLEEVYDQPYAGHSFGSWVVTKNATDHSAGIETRTCGVCGEEEDREFYPDGTCLRGSYGSDVAELQRMLIDTGFLYDTADGSYGPKTEEAVRNFQSACYLNADGIAWPQTQRELSIYQEAMHEQQSSGSAGAFAGGLADDGRGPEEESYAGGLADDGREPGEESYAGGLADDGRGPEEESYAGGLADDGREPGEEVDGTEKASAGSSVKSGGTGGKSQTGTSGNGVKENEGTASEEELPEAEYREFIESGYLEWQKKRPEQKEKIEKAHKAFLDWLQTAEQASVSEGEAFLQKWKLEILKAEAKRLEKMLESLTE